MTLKIAGGCGEHGRNCFLVDTETEMFLVDCGTMAGTAEPFPRLSAEEISRINYLFLTHSHADHTGAIPWLCENGFSGKIIASADTLEQLPFAVKNAVPIEELCKDNQGKIGNIEFQFGRAGHCAGSVWYHFFVGGKSLLFSGDYNENSLAYYCDKILDRTADIAVLDCAYGYDKRTFGECCEEIVSAVKRLKKEHRTLIFPVPKYGRGIDLLMLFRKQIPELVCCGDKHFTEQLSEMNNKKSLYKTVDISADLYEPNRSCDILFLSDPQLRSEQSRKITEQLLSHNGYAVMTGTVERGSFSDELILAGKMMQLRYPVHLNFDEYQSISQKNNFRCTIPYHTAEITPDAVKNHIYVS